MVPLVVENAVKRYRQGDRQVQALNGVSLSVTEGNFLAIMGASGSGKSTLLHLMAGLTTADSGVVRVHGQELAGMSDKALTLFRWKWIGLVFQSFNLIPTLTAEENIGLPLLLRGSSTTEIRPKVEELMSVLGIAGRRTHRPDSMSGGEQQRVAIGRALVNDPAVILADEPTGNLDSTNSRSVCELLRNLCDQQNKTIVMVTHEPTVAAYAKQIAVLKDGNVCDSFSVDEANNGAGVAMRYQETVR